MTNATNLSAYIRGDTLPCDCCGSADWRPLFSENGIRLGQCPQCDLLSIDDIPRLDARMTELEAGHYAGDLQVLDASKQLEAERILESRWQSFVDLAAPHVSSGRWLDIGCGAGLLLTLAGRAGFEGEGVELNADRRAVAAQVTGNAIHGLPVEDVGFADASFDVVSLINVFSHLVSPTRTLAEIHRILRPGGVLIMATGEITAGVRKSHMHNWNLGDHLHFLGDHTLDQYAAKLEFEVAERKRAWLPDEMYTNEWLRVRGRSKSKNAIKTGIRVTPGGLAALRAIMLRRQAGSAAHSGTFVLRVPE